MARNFSSWSCKDRAQKIYDDFGNVSSKNSKRRWYQHDIDQIVYSSEFRKLQGKAQLLSYEDPRCRSRLIHTLEVNRISKEISDKLGLCSELTEAISLAHDLANVAHGAPIHELLGEKISTEKSKRFLHEEASALMILSLTKKSIENDLKNSIINEFSGSSSSKFEIMDIGDSFPNKIFVSFKYDARKSIYNYHSITREVIDGVVKHGTSEISDTLEGQVVNYADTIAYLSQDIDDFIAAGIITDTLIERFEALKDGPLTYNGITKTWKEINGNSSINLQEVFSASSSMRMGTLIGRFIECNLNKLKKSETDNKHETHFSNILQKEIPILYMDDGLKFVIDYLWNYNSIFYENPLIKVANNLNKSKINALWEVLDFDGEFIQNNKTYMDFIAEKRNDPLYLHYKAKKKFSDDEWKNWLKAFFISHLTGSEIDLILTSFQQRDYTFELDI